MAERARAAANHVLVFCGSHVGRTPASMVASSAFLGDGYAFDDLIRGWRTLDDAAYELTVMEQLIDAAMAESVTKLPFTLARVGQAQWIAPAKKGTGGVR